MFDFNFKELEERVAALMVDKECKDFYVEKAAELNNIPVKDVSPTMRQNVKDLYWGYHYARL